VYFDGQPLATTGFVDRGPLHTALDQLTDADISALATQSNAASRNATGTAYFDNFKIVNGESGEYLRADGNRDGVVDALDLQLWKDHYGLDYTGGGSSMAAAAAAVAATPQAPAGFFASSTPRFEASRLEVSLAEAFTSVADASPTVRATNVSWLAYDSQAVSGRLLPSVYVHRANEADARLSISSTQRDAALAQLDGDYARADLSGSCGDDDEGEDAVDFETEPCSALDALFAEL
jgi:hypothetical protein